MPRRRLIASATALSVALGTAVLGAQAASAAPPTPPPPHAGDSAKLDRAAVAKVHDGLLTAKGHVTAFVQLDTRSGAQVAAAGGSPKAVKAAAATTQDVAADVVPTKATRANARSATPKRLGTTTNLVAGTLVTGDAAQVSELAASPDVVAVYRVVPKEAATKNTDTFTRALQTWQDTGVTGKGVRIGIIDTGLDYTHADFGGAGTVAAYQAAYGKDGTQPIPAGSFDPAKFAGGYDFAGPNYDADPSSQLPGATTVPTPDPNPIDAPTTSDNVGHGTHVAGIAAGYGVQPDGTTFRGDYSSLTDLSTWVVGPGAAPSAELYSLKVFGDIGGVTNLVTLALDRAADPNGDGDLSDRFDVLNMSLGSSGSPADDPDNLLVDQLTQLGTVVTISSGNSGDVTDIGGSPGNSPSAITVANSVGDPQTHDGIDVTAASDSSLLGLHAAQNSTSYTGPDVTAPVAYVGARFDGCAKFTADQAATVKGKIAYLWWDDDDTTRVCGSAARFNNAQAAGAVGVLLPSSVTVFSAGILGNTGIPGAQMTRPTTEALLPEIEAGTLSVKIGPSLAGAVTESVVGDALNPSSSRGVHGSLGLGKPDVAAPGTDIQSAGSGTGNQSETLSGTSMAAPHVAGIAALVRAAHPSWEPTQVKAAIVNTATHDVWTGPHQTGTAYGPQRVGSGRVDARDAVGTSVLAYDTQTPEATSVSFGVVDVGATTVTRKKTVTVKNLGTTSARYSTSFVASQTSGASVSVSPASFTLAAGRSTIVTLTFTADPAKLVRQNDPTSADVQDGVPREYVAETAGRLVLTSSSQQLRVPVEAAPRLVSSLSAKPVTFASRAAATAGLALTGRGVASGGWYSLTTPLVLGATSPRLEDDPSLVTSPSVRRSADIRYVGWASTAPAVEAAGGDAADGLLGIGIATDGDWADLVSGGATASTFQPVIDIDVDGDGTDDLETVVQKLADEADVTVAATFDDATGDVVGVELVNEFAGDVESGIFDNNVLVAPIPLSAIPAGSTPRITVSTYSGYAQNDTGLLDSARPFTVDPYDPPFWFENDIEGTFSTLGDGGTVIPVHRGTGATTGRLLVLQHGNADARSRAQVVRVTVPAAKPTSTTLAVSGGGTAGSPVHLRATVAPSVAGSVTFLDGSTTLATTAVNHGRADATVRLGAGRHAVSAVFTPSDPAYAGSTSRTVTVKVAKSASATSVHLSRSSVPAGAAVAATVPVRGWTVAPSGTVQLREGSTVLGTGTLTVSGLTGTATIDLPRTLKPGSHRLTAVYAGSADVAGSQATATLTVHAAS
ncbi:S8 family serine peptidase [Cellulomonas alba]|uniref:S8 family serine peptidase n=1 Tax=Cellulomonas alba TaxID=3053467 RepID=A0ABT7SG13_9CELL|nr:S8 family serine peptidase [Cellulomonas alba]MDM7855076.1 S8 family serine peptidase [Cellulomonas alba]